MSFSYRSTMSYSYRGIEGTNTPNKTTSFDSKKQSESTSKSKYAQFGSKEFSTQSTKLSQQIKSGRSHEVTKFHQMSDGGGRYGAT